MGFVFSKRYKAKYSLPKYLAVLQSSGAVFMWGVALATSGLPHGLLAMPPIGWLSLAFVSLVACGFCFCAVYWLLNFMDGHKLAFFDCFHSVCAALFGVVLFGDRPNFKMFVGGTLLLASLVLALPSSPGSTISPLHTIFVTAWPRASGC